MDCDVVVVVVIVAIIIDIIDLQDKSSELGGGVVILVTMK